jgi:uncharacterized RDD family membrane protein YckC
VLLILLDVSIGSTIHHHPSTARAVAELLQGVYVVGMIAYRGQTLGMMAVDVEVHTQKTGVAQIGIPRSLLRWGAAVAIGLAATLGIPFALALPVLDFLWPLWDPNNQTLHDKVAGTVVVRA